MDKKTGAENVRWDLSFMYKGPDDPAIDEDLTKLMTMARLFEERYRGNLHILLGEALKDMCEIDMLSSKIVVYLFLNQSVNLRDEKFLKRTSDINTELNTAFGQHLTFFDLELVRLDDAIIKAQAAKDTFLQQHLSYVIDARKGRAHIFSEEVECALAKRSSLSAASWASFFDEVAADLVFKWRGKNKNLEEMTHILSNHSSPSVRAKALKVINDGLSGNFAKFSAQTLNMITGAKSLEDKERGYPHPMASRNDSNKIPDEVVEALHTAVKNIASPIMKRYYKLKAKLLKLPKLKWSDRNAKLNLRGKSEITTFEDALKIVLNAYRSFSPTLAEIVEDAVKNKRIDAPVTPNRRGGAYNYSIVLPGNKPVSFTFLNYLGSKRDIMTLAHELGHGVHGILAGKAQGALMFRAPIAFAETASVFGEMTTFNHLRATTGGERELLALLLSKIDDMANTAVRQIGFSNFEQRIHSANGRLSIEEFCKIWLESTQELYGKDGEIFTYENTEYLWSYISHFHRPFYVYGYSFGELLTQSLYAEREKLGDKFELLYLEMLRSGGTKDAVALLKPFGLDPTNTEFWRHGIEVSLGKMVDEAETLAKNLKLV